MNSIDSTPLCILAANPERLRGTARLHWELFLAALLVCFLASCNAGDVQGIPPALRRNISVNKCTVRENCGGPRCGGPRCGTTTSVGDLRISRFADGTVSDIWHVTIQSGKEIEEGQYFAFDGGGRLLSSGRYSSGQRQGEWRTYHPNTQVWNVQSYKDDIRVGVRKVFSENGCLVESSEYKNGVVEGSFLSWYDSGQSYVVGQYVGGLKEGEWIEKRPEGQVASKKNFQLGLPHGEQLFFNLGGQRVCQRIFDKGVQTRELQWSDDGELIMWWPTRPKGE